MARRVRWMKALIGLSQAQFDRLLPVISDTYQGAQHHAYATGLESGTRQPQTGRWRQRETAHDGGLVAICPLLLQDVSHL
jgi:hypothetical protein